MPCWRPCAMPLAMRAGELRVPLADVAVGEHCHVRRSACDDRVLTHGVVTRVDHGVATLALIGAPVRLAADVVVAATGRPLQVALGNHLLGCVLDGFGEVVERLHDGQAPEASATATASPVQAAPLDYRQRRPILTPFATGTGIDIRRLPVTVDVVLCQLQQSIAELDGLQPGTVFNLPHDAWKQLQLRVNGQVVARGELVQVGDQLGVQLAQAPVLP
ncbi:FliM/FliN family flagellar motor switch protein [Paracidovorax citrulli]